MKAFIGNNHTMLLLMGLSLAGMQAAQANSSFNSSATLTYIIDGIVNETNPGDLSGLVVLGSFEQSNAPGYSDFKTGDGVVLDNNLPRSWDAGFTHTFALSGGVNNGRVDSLHLGWYGLEFQNTSTDSYSISLRLNYGLNAGIAGDYAASTVSVNYFNSDELRLSGYDEAVASFVARNVVQTGTSGLFNFILGAGAVEGLYADVTIDSHLEASPVPLPAAVWSFLAGLLGILSIKKHKRGSAESV